VSRPLPWRWGRRAPTARPARRTMGGAAACGWQELPVGHLPPALSPEPLHRVEPRTTGQQAQQDEAPCGRADDRFDCIVEGRAGMIPGHLDGASRGRINQGLQPFGHFPAALPVATQQHGFTAWSLTAPRPYRVVGCPGVRTILCGPCGLHRARNVGRQPTLYSSA
jgi:hypothetical protein